jgi:hypothetical protein
MGGCCHVAALEHLVEVHLGHAARGVVGVVVASGVDHHAVEHALHLGSTSSSSFSSSPGSMNSAMLSLALKRLRAA